MEHNRYEILILGAPEITTDEERAIEAQLTEMIQNHKGTVLSFERWGKFKLYYPVRKNEYGVYYLMRFQATADRALLDEIRSLFVIRFDVPVMRHLVTSLGADASLEYQRPRSLEEAPQEGFVKDRSFDRKHASDEMVLEDGMAQEL